MQMFTSNIASANYQGVLRGTTPCHLAIDVSNSIASVAVCRRPGRAGSRRYRNSDAGLRSIRSVASLGRSLDCSLLPAVSPTTASVPVMVVLDASGSMNETDAPGPRIDAAKKAVTSLVTALPAGTNVGLRRLRRHQRLRRSRQGQRLPGHSYPRAGRPPRPGRHHLRRRRRQGVGLHAHRQRPARRRPGPAEGRPPFDRARL